MKLSNNKSAKTERLYPPHEATKLNERRKYSVCQLELVPRVERVAKIQERVKRNLECRWLWIDLKTAGINRLQDVLEYNGLRYSLEMQ